jgi:predicted transposase/invertase (TIGR01784 family)
MLQDRILTYSEEARLEGIEKGIEKGKLEVARNMFASGISSDIIVKTTGLPLDQIKGLMN